MAKSKSHDEIIEAICDYKKGLDHSEQRNRELAELTGLSPDIAAALLKEYETHTNVTQIRGYSKEKDYQIAGKKGKSTRQKNNPTLQCEPSRAGLVDEAIGHRRGPIEQ